MQEALDIGEEVRHLPHYRALYYNVFDRKYCLSAINIMMRHYTLDEPISMLLSDDTVYATYLVSTFELFWEQSVPADGRIQELLEQATLSDQ